MHLAIEIRIDAIYGKVITDHKPCSCGCHVSHVVVVNWPMKYCKVRCVCSASTCMLSSRTCTRWVLWMPCKSRSSDQLAIEILQCMLCLLHPSLLSSQRCTRWTLCTEQQAAIYLSEQPYTSYKVRVLSLAGGPHVENPGFCYCALSSANRPQDIHPLPQNWKVLLVGWLSLWREGCVTSVAQSHLGLVILGES